MIASPAPEDSVVNKAENLLSWNLHSSGAGASDLFPHPPTQSCTALDTVWSSQDLNLDLPVTDPKAVSSGTQLHRRNRTNTQYVWSDHL